MNRALLPDKYVRHTVHNILHHLHRQSMVGVCCWFQK